MRCQTPGHSPYPLRIGSGVTGRRDGHFFGGNVDEDKKIVQTRKILLDIIVEDKKIIKSKQEKLKTLKMFKRIWEAQDSDSLRKETFRLLGKSTVTLSK